MYPIRVADLSTLRIQDFCAPFPLAEHRREFRFSSPSAASPKWRSFLPTASTCTRFIVFPSLVYLRKIPWSHRRPSGISAGWLVTLGRLYSVGLSLLSSPLFFRIPAGYRCPASRDGDSWRNGAGKDDRPNSQLGSKAWPGTGVCARLNMIQ